MAAGPGRGAGGRWQGLAGLRDATPKPPHTNVAHNFPRSLLEIARKHCNPNNMNSIFETLTGELRAKLLRRRQDHRQTNFACNSIRLNFNKPRKRCNSNDANSMFEQAAGELHAKLMIDSHNWATYSNPGPGRGAGGWRQGLAATTQTISTARLEAAARPAGPGRASRRRAATHSTAGTTGVEGAGGPGDLDAVPVGGGRAWPGFETTRRAKLAARTARGRAAAHRHTQRPGHAKRAGTEVPAPCRLTQPLPRRGSGRMTISPGDGDASTGTCRQRRPLPGPLRR